MNSKRPILNLQQIEPYTKKGEKGKTEAQNIFVLTVSAEAKKTKYLKRLLT